MKLKVVLEMPVESSKQVYLNAFFSIGLNVNMNILCWILPFALLEWLYLDDVCKITLFTNTFEISPLSLYVYVWLYQKKNTNNNEYTLVD